MVSASRSLLIPVLVAGWLGLIAPAFAAVAPLIKDGGKFFSADAVAKANEKIKKIAQTYNKDLLIETFADIPDDLKKDYKPEDKKGVLREVGARSSPRECGQRRVRFDLQEALAPPGRGRQRDAEESFHVAQSQRVGQTVDR